MSEVSLRWTSCNDKCFFFRLLETKFFFRTQLAHNDFQWNPSQFVVWLIASCSNYLYRACKIHIKQPKHISNVLRRANQTFRSQSAIIVRNDLNENVAPSESTEPARIFPKHEKFVSKKIRSVCMWREVSTDWYTRNRSVILRDPTKSNNRNTTE